jgi:lysylphosphatidylglycerol synthetase-like protein (DUF2156 family)
MRERAADIVARHGHGALVPFLVRRGMRSVVVGDAAVVFGRAGRVVVALGDPIGEGDAAWAAFDAFTDRASAVGSIPAVYQATEAARPPLVDRRFRLVPVGAEAIVDLAGFDLTGARRANLRHTVTRARRGGLRVEVHLRGVPEERATAFRPAFQRLDARWRATAGPAMGFTISTFRWEDLVGPDAPALSVALDVDDRPVAFATFRRTGTDGGWVLDLMRRDRDGVPGALEWCIAEAASAFASDGATQLSLGLAPLAGLRTSGPDVGREERALARAAALVRPAYDVAGLAFFKDKYAPRWESRYLAARGTPGLVAATLALLRLHLAPPGTTVGQAVGAALFGLLPEEPPDGPSALSLAPPDA